VKASALVKNAPNSLIYSVAAIFVAAIAAFVVLAVTDSSSTEFRSFLNTVLNIAAVALSGGAAVAAGSAAKSSANAETQTNGVLDQKIENAVRRAIYTPDGGNHPENG
jgi:hypothetical protein